MRGAAHRPQLEKGGYLPDVVRLKYEGSGPWRSCYHAVRASACLVSYVMACRMASPYRVLLEVFVLSPTLSFASGQAFLFPLLALCILEFALVPLPLLNLDASFLCC